MKSKIFSPVSISLIIVSAAALIGIGILLLYSNNARTYSAAGLSPENSSAVNVPPAGMACTLEAKLCPDGTYVGRTGPNCEFTKCPSTGSAGQQ